MVDLVKPADYVAEKNCSCGAEDAAFDYVPDTVYGLSIKEACCIHDYMYAGGLKQWDKERSDRIFLENMLHIIAEGTKWAWLRYLRKQRAYKYYMAVVKFGGPSFWSGKNKDENEKTQEAA